MLVLFGLAMLSTASAILAFQHTGDNYFYVKRQLFNGMIPGLILFFLASFFSYKKLKLFALPFMSVSIILLALLFVPSLGVMKNGATRWLSLGFFSFQPSELLKLASLIYLSALFSGRREKILQSPQVFVPFIAVMGVVFAFLAWQPDLGTLGIISLTAFSLYFIAGARLKHIAIAVLCGILALFIFMYGFGYGSDRISVFLNPQTDIQGSGYQIHKARAAIDAGGAWGIGFGQSQRKLSGYLPEPMGDSIFAIVAEELGFAGVAVVMGLFAWFGWQGFHIAKNASDMFGSLLAAGVTLWVLIQACINIAAISGLLPLTGVPLPFVSYGGTSLAVLLTACGIVYNIQKQV